MLVTIVVLAIFAGCSAVPTADVAVFPEDRSPSSRIVSGWEAEDGQFPHQLYLRGTSTWGTVAACGASLIHNEWALTAAHCTARRAFLLLSTGSPNTKEHNILIDSIGYFTHPEYREILSLIVQSNDISLIRFRRIEYIPSLVQPIRIQNSADKDRSYAGLQTIASGWGRLWTNAASPDHLNWVYLRVVTNDECVNAFNNAIVVDSTICAAGYNDTTQSTCQGDSGGPLTVIDRDNKITLVGVTSFGSAEGCHEDFPAGFIRPGHYHSWITEITGLNFDWDFESSDAGDVSSSGSSVKFVNAADQKI